MVDPARQVLAALMARRRNVVEMRVAESTRLEHAAVLARRSIQRVLSERLAIPP